METISLIILAATLILSIVTGKEIECRINNTNDIEKTEIEDVQETK